MPDHKIKVVVADDEQGMRMILRRVIERTEGFELVGEAQNAAELLSLVEQEHPNVCFLDVEMPDMTGLDCAKIIQDMDPRTILIFATAHDDYMAEAFELYAFDYMVKPFKLERLNQTLARVKQVVMDREPSAKTDVFSAPRQNTPNPYPGRIMIRHKDGVNFVDENDILLIQRENRSTVLYVTGDRRFETSEALGDLETRLNPGIFFRCHKSYIINLNAVDAITPYGRWTYVVHLNGTKQDALITHDKYEELQRIFS